LSDGGFKERVEIIDFVAVSVPANRDRRDILVIRVLFGGFVSTFGGLICDGIRDIRRLRRNDIFVPRFVFGIAVFFDKLFFFRFIDNSFT
jgi:hypothetical protein